VGRFLAYDEGHLWLTLSGALTGLDRPLLQAPSQRVDATMPFGFEPWAAAEVGQGAQLSPRPLVLVARSPPRPFALRLRVAAGQVRLEALPIGSGVVSVTRDWLVVGAGRPSELRFLPLNP